MSSSSHPDRSPTPDVTRFLAAHGSTGLVRELVTALRSLDGYQGLLAFGSVARGTASTSSDLDLVLLTAASVEPERVHSARVDLNLLTPEDLEAVADRVSRSDGMPWDSMFEDVAVLDDPYGTATTLAAALADAFQTAAAAASWSTDALRFLILRRLKRLRATEPADLLIGQTRLLAAFACVCSAHESVRGRAWQGLDLAMDALSDEVPEAASELCAAMATVPDYAAAADRIEAAAAVVLAESGGLWAGEPLTLGAGVARAEPPTPRLALPSSVQHAIVEALRQFG